MLTLVMVILFALTCFSAVALGQAFGKEESVTREEYTRGTRFAGGATFLFATLTVALLIHMANSGCS